MNYSPANVTTFLLIGFTVWLIVIGRFKLRLDSNWPLFYYVFVVIFHQSMPGRIHPFVLYASVVCALLLRFEFMGGWFRSVLRTAEIICLLVIIYGLATHLSM